MLENGKFCCRRRPSFLHALQRMVQTKSPPLFDPCTRQGFLPFLVFLRQHVAFLDLSSSLARWKSRCLAAWDGVSLNQSAIQNGLERCKAKLKLRKVTTNVACNRRHLEICTRSQHAFPSDVIFFHRRKFIVPGIIRTSRTAALIVIFCTSWSSVQLYSY